MTGRLPVAKIKTIEQGDVNITEPHFLISYTHELGPDNRQPIAVLSITDNIQNMRLSTLIYGLDAQTTNALHNELNFYLYSKGERDPISYLVYHCSTMANAYSNIGFTYVPEINKNNFLYYIKTQSKLLGIFLNSFIADIQQCYLQHEVKLIFDKALYKTNPDAVEDYNKNLNYFYRLIFIVLPKQEGFIINDKFTLVEFAQYISTLSIKEFSFILNYLRHIKLNNTGVMRLLKFYHTNQIQYKK